MRAAGRLVLDIAKGLGVHEWTVRHYTGQARVTQWTDERVEKLRALYAEGLTCSQIAARLGGVTRNGVIGKLHRIGLHRAKDNRFTKVSKSNVNLPKRKRKRAAPCVVKSAPATPPEPIGGTGAPITALGRNQCRWATGHDGTQHLFCGAETRPGKVYCDHHAARAIAKVQPEAPKRRDALAPSWRAM